MWLGYLEEQSNARARCLSFSIYSRGFGRTDVAIGLCGGTVISSLTKVCIKSPCTVSTALLALREVHGLLIQTLPTAKAGWWNIPNLSQQNLVTDHQGHAVYGPLTVFSNEN